MSKKIRSLIFLLFLMMLSMITYPAVKTPSEVTFDGEVYKQAYQDGDGVKTNLVTDYLRKLRDEGKLVIVSTHIMSEAEKLCDRIGIIIDGTKVAEGTLEELLQQTNAQDLEDAFFEFYKLRRE